MHHETRAAPAADRHRRCPCGAVTERPGTLCSKCQARMAWRRKYDATRRRATRRIVRRQTRDSAQLLASALAMLSTSKGVEK
jgi:hypothetical protein